MSTTVANLSPLSPAQGPDPAGAWWDLNIIAAPAQEDQIFWRLESFGCQGMASQAYGEDRISIHAYLPWFRATLLDLAALALRLRQDALVAGQPLPKLRWERIEAEDWSNSWKQHWQPEPVGDKLLICPAWLDPPPHPGRLLLRLDPGMAFGTGTHPTTQLCLESLEMRLESGDPLAVTVADVGCGSGILSVAAALLGAKRVFAVDIDPLAVQATLQNRDLNGLTDRIVVAQGSLEHIPEVVDGLVCNILTEVILDMIPEFGLVVKKGGWLILSGILIEQAKLVAEMLEANEWVVAALWRRGEWCCLNARTT
ncbi:50S ribosomal protein L11 methyltransferase [Synechococcus sp. H55.2]|uniref:50S ribosomal protein L11 methyltransferase n=1 Tax=Synechococcus sp. H55.2 TaxID=2964505 RepID=UPI0039C22299